MPRFRWNEWNVDHIEKHGVAPAEAEVVIHFPLERKKQEEGKFRVVGRGQGGRW